VGAGAGAVVGAHTGKGAIASCAGNIASIGSGDGAT